MPFISEQFNKSQLSAYNNCWADIIDATPSADERNFQLIPDVSSFIQSGFNYIFINAVFLFG